MCVYCMCGDWIWKHYPPFIPVDPIPHIPWPVIPTRPRYPHVPWSIDKLREMEDLLRRIKELEDKLGCPCEPSKADHLGILKRRIEQLEKHAVDKDFDVEL